MEQNCSSQRYRTFPLLKTKHGKVRERETPGHLFHVVEVKLYDSEHFDVAGVKGKIKQGN